MIASSHEGLNPREIARILFRHWRKMAYFFFGVIALTLVVISIYPRSYSSESKLFIQVGRETVALDPTATTGQIMLLQKSQANEINSALDILSSSEIEQRVVEMVGPERILKDHPKRDADAPTAAIGAVATDDAATTSTGWLKPLLAKVGLSDPASEKDLAIRRLDKGVRVWAPKESTIITVQYRAASPELAHDVVDATVKAFLEEHLHLNRVEGSLEFFSEQAETLHEKLSAAHAELRDHKNEFQMASLLGKQAIFDEQVKDVELQILRVQRDLAFSDAKVADLTRALGELDPEIVTARVAGFANEARDGMREKLYELELQESKLRSSYQDSHPLLMQVRRQREQAERILADLPEDRTQTTLALNPNQRLLELQLVGAEAESKALRARQAVASEQINRLHDQLRKLNDRELQIAELQRNVEILEQKYRMHVEKLEQARVNDELGRGRITNVKVAQPATLTSKPISPNKRLLLAFGLLVATGGALGLAFVCETVDQTFRTPEQVESALGSRVLLSFSKKKQRQSDPLYGAPAARKKVAINRHTGVPRDGRYRELARELLFCGDNNFREGRGHGKTVGIVGCDASKSRSRVAAKLAVQAAQAGAGRVLLIDTDARRRGVAKRFHLNGSAGWSDVIGGMADVESCIHQSTADNLAIMTPGALGSATLATEPMPGLLGQLDEIKSDYGLVVVDLPPSREWDGPPVTADWVDEAVLVIEAERTRVHAARRAKESLERAGIRLAGVVLANRRDHIPDWLYRRL